MKILRYIAVDDCGPPINPMIVDGQVHGGVIQGIGEAMQEIAIYDDEASSLTGTMMDYAVPKASQMPHLEVAPHLHALAGQPAGREGHAARPAPSPPRPAS